MCACVLACARVRAGEPMFYLVLHVPGRGQELCAKPWAKCILLAGQQFTQSSFIAVLKRKCPQLHRIPAVCPHEVNCQQQEQLGKREWGVERDWVQAHGHTRVHAHTNSPTHTDTQTHRHTPTQTHTHTQRLTEALEKRLVLAAPEDRRGVCHVLAVLSQETQHFLVCAVRSNRLPRRHIVGRQLLNRLACGAQRRATGHK